MSTDLSSTPTEVDHFDVVFQQFTGTAGLFEAYLSYFTQTSANTSILDFKVKTDSNLFLT